jgi:hypothetical protein
LAGAIPARCRWERDGISLDEFLISRSNTGCRLDEGQHPVVTRSHPEAAQESRLFRNRRGSCREAFGLSGDIDPRSTVLRGDHQLRSGRI